MSHTLAIVLLLAGCRSTQSPRSVDLGTEALLARSGQATFYAADGAGHCSFLPSPDDLMVVALNTADYAGARWCGACLLVRYRDKTLRLRVVDSCPTCAAGDIDLSREAFARLADPDIGILDVDWQIVPCELSAAVRFRYNDLASRWWLAVQVQQSRYPVRRFEARPAGSGDYAELPRAEYNYFVRETGLGDGPFDFRLTDIRGEQIVEEAVPFSPGASIVGSAQFSP